MISNLTFIWLYSFLKLVKSLELFFCPKLLFISELTFTRWRYFLSLKYMRFSYIKHNFMWRHLWSLKSSFVFWVIFISFNVTFIWIYVFLKFFLEWMVESRFRTWFRAKNPIDEELRRKNPVWFNFSGSQNSKLSLRVFYSSFHVRASWHTPPSRINNGNGGRRDIAICAICFLLFILLLWAAPLCFFCYVLFCVLFVMCSFIMLCLVICCFIIRCLILYSSVMCSFIMC